MGGAVVHTTTISLVK